HGLEGGTGPGGLVTGNDQGEPLGAHRRKSGSHVCVQVGLPEVFALAVGVLGTPPRTLGGQIEPGYERAYTVGDGGPRGQDTTDGSEEGHVGDAEPVGPAPEDASLVDQGLTDVEHHSTNSHAEGVYPAVSCVRVGGARRTRR